MENRIKQILGVTKQTVLANESKVPDATVSRIVLGQREPTAKQMFDLTQALRRITGNYALSLTDVFPEPQEVKS